MLEGVVFCIFLLGFLEVDVNQMKGKPNSGDKGTQSKRAKGEKWETQHPRTQNQTNLDRETTTTKIRDPKPQDPEPKNHRGNKRNDKRGYPGG